MLRGGLYASARGRPVPGYASGEQDHDAHRGHPEREEQHDELEERDAEQHDQRDHEADDHEPAGEAPGAERSIETEITNTAAARTP